MLESQSMLCNEPEQYDATIHLYEGVTKVAREKARFSNSKLPFNPSFPQITLEESVKENVLTLIEYYDEAIEKNPENDEYYWKRALAHMDVQYWNFAKNDLHKMLELRPDFCNSDAYFNYYLGVTYLNLKDFSFAVRSLYSALRLSQNFSQDQITELKVLIWKNSEETRRSESIRELREKVELNSSATKEEERLFKSLFEIDAPFTTRKVPEFFNCPIGHGVMDDPVVTESGISYDCVSLRDYISYRRGKNLQITDPHTRKPIRAVAANLALIKMVDWFKDTNGWVYNELKEKE